MKDVATTCVLRAANASKYVCGRGSARTPLGELNSSSPDLAGFGGGRGKRRGEMREGKVGPQAKILPTTFVIGFVIILSRNVKEVCKRACETLSYGKTTKSLSVENHQNDCGDSLHVAGKWPLL